MLMYADGLLKSLLSLMYTFTKACIVWQCIVYGPLLYSMLKKRSRFENN